MTKRETFKEFRKRLDEWGKVSVTWRDDKLTIVNIAYGGFTATGIARRMDKDTPNPEIGLAVAIGDAQRKIYDMHKQVMSISRNRTRHAPQKTTP